MSIKKILFSGLFLLSLPIFAFAQNNSAAANQTALPEINFFYSLTCTNCQHEEKFLDELVQKYPDLKINRYEVTKSDSAVLLKKLSEQYGAEQYQGLVPITFIGKRFVVGFDSKETTGVKIEALIKNQNEDSSLSGAVCDENSDIASCEVDTINTTKYDIINNSGTLGMFGLTAQSVSLPLLSILLGFFDGFNVCSLGALILILSLVFSFKSKKRIFVFGGAFLIITGITYAMLITFWAKIFSIISPFIHAFEIVIGLIGLLGGIYFLNEFIKFRKYGPQCETISNPFLKKAVVKLQNIFSSEKSIAVTLGAVVVFAFIVTILEFPCSAVIPVAFSAILAEAGISSGAYWLYLGLFMLFYLIDELIVFLIATWTMKIWVSSSKMTTWLVLIQAIVFIALGVFYLGKLFF